VYKLKASSGNGSPLDRRYSESTGDLIALQTAENSP